MRKISIAVLAVLIMLALGASPILAADNAANDKGQAGKSNVQFLYLYEKNPSDWTFVWDGAWGKLKGNVAGDSFKFVFNGHLLQPGEGYSLIYYPEPQTTWPWPVTVITSGEANSEGDVHLKGMVDLGEDLTNAKIWLVLTDDIVDGSLSGWNPSDYLFEHNLINYDDTDA